MLRLFILMGLFGLASSVGWAQTLANQYTVLEIQQIGLEANGLVQAARSQVNIAKAGVIAARAYPNPEVTVMAGPDHGRYPGKDTEGPFSMQRSVTVNQAIENPFMRSSRIGAAEAFVEAGRASFDQARTDLAAQLRVRTYELLLRQEQAALEQNIYSLIEDVRRRIKHNVERGEAARFELVRAD
ncbi:MAG TPA: TolC family protein, partial [Nitrosomonas sp.]|nr:TolC family protein [Nitrosomonas sp.]